MGDVRPVFRLDFLCTPWMERVRGNPAPAAALSMVAAAVVGVILNLALWFAVHSLFTEVVLWQCGPLRLSLPVPGSFVPWSAMLTSLALGLVFGLRWGMGRLLLRWRRQAWSCTLPVKCEPVSCGTTRKAVARFLFRCEVMAARLKL